MRARGLSAATMSLLVLGENRFGGFALLHEQNRAPSAGVLSLVNDLWPGFR